MSKALETQVGGEHYRKQKIQPIEYIHANGLDFIQGCVVKYITRFRDKNGKEDLLKIKHYIDLLIELEYPETAEAKLEALDGDKDIGFGYWFTACPKCGKPLLTNGKDTYPCLCCNPTAL